MKMTTPPNMNYAWTELVVRELLRLGAEHFFVAPGSRSSPLALAAAEYGKNLTVHFDERGLGFAALGCARATGKPAVVITTSGTAAANLLPAVCEASQDEIPMILITADRPPELRDTCANQTMNQVNLFGHYARWFVDMPCPDPSVSAESVLGTIDHAYERSVSERPGPVHINQMLREPLAPEKMNDGAIKWRNTVSVWLQSSKPYSSFGRAIKTVEASALIDAADCLARAKRGLIVLGSMSDAASQQGAQDIARRLRWPVIPDIRSGLRIGKAGSRVIQFADQVLLSNKFANANTADVVLHLGGRITSKRIQKYIGKSNARVIMVNPSPVRMEQGAVPFVRLHADIVSFAGQLPTFSSIMTKSWLGNWQAADEAVRSKWLSMITNQKVVTEPLIAAQLSTSIPDDHSLVLANSMPIRDMEMYGIRLKKPIVVTANRGVSGIDGTLATAVGCAIGSKQPVTLVIGDLALLHDLNSLALLGSVKSPVMIVVINNNGGGIFSLLPIASAPSHYEKCFGTPHGLGFEEAARMFNLIYSAPGGIREFTDAYKTAIRKSKSCLIEVRTDRADNAAEHRRIQTQLKRAVEYAVR